MQLRESSGVGINVNGNNQSRRADRSVIVDNNARRTRLIAFPVVTASRSYSSQIIPSPLALISNIKTFVTTLTCRYLEENDFSVHAPSLKFFSF